MDKPECIIQWKGTFACLDLHCSCGQHDHIDDEFVYYWRCSKCGTVYRLSNNIEITQVPIEELGAVEKNTGVIK